MKIVKDWVASKSYEEIDALAQQYSFGAEKVHNGIDHYTDPHFEVRGFKWTIDDAILGESVEEGIAPKLSETPGRIKWMGKPVGFDNEYVFTKYLGLTTEQLKALEEKGVIGKWADMIGRTPPDDWDGESGRIFP